MLLVLITLLICVPDYPDGTLVLSSKPNTLVGNIAKRLTNGDQYTHIGIVVDNKVYESDWPRAKSTYTQYYGKHKTINDYYIPTTPYTNSQVVSMRNSVQQRVGQPYQLRNYLRPNSRRTKGTWCSPFVQQTLNDSGRYKLSNQQGYEPQSLIESVIQDYSFTQRVYR